MYPPPRHFVKFSTHAAGQTHEENACNHTVKRLNSEIRKILKFAKRDKLSITDFTDGVIIAGQASRKVKTEKAITSTVDYYKLLST